MSPALLAVFCSLLISGLVLLAIASPVAAQDPPIPARYSHLSLAAGLGGGAALGWNAWGVHRGNPSSIGITLGVAAGITSMALGAMRLDEGRPMRHLALANLAIGSFALGSAIHAGRSIRPEIRPILIPVMAPGPAGPVQSSAFGVAATISF